MGLSLDAVQASRGAVEGGRVFEAADGWQWVVDSGRRSFPAIKSFARVS